MRLPSHWSIKKFEDISEIITGSTPSTASPEYYGGNIPFVTPGDLDSGVPITCTPSTLTDLGAAQARILPKGTVLVCCIGATIGKTDIAGTQLASNQQINSLVCNPEIAHPEYVYQYARTLKAKLIHMSSSTTLPIVNKSRFKQIEIPLPPLDEQKRIAAILDQADALRVKRRAALARLDDLVQSVFLEMFGDPVTNPMGWEVRPFNAVVTNLDSKRIPIKQADRDQRHGEYPYYGASGVIDFVDDYIFDETALLIAEDGMNLKFRRKPIAFIASDQYWVNNHAHVLTENGVVKLDYLCTLINLIDISQYVTGIDQMKLNRENMDRIPVSVPPLDLQYRFVETLDSIIQQQTRMNLGVDKLDALFHSLQQRAFCGEL